MLVIPQLMPDENLPGFLGRVLRVNALGLPNMYTAVKVLREAAYIPSVEAPTGFNLIARLLARGANDLVENHTLSPWRGIFKRRQAKGGGPQSLAASIRPLRPYLSMCPQCTIEDLEFHGFSYWKRSHQIIGAHECLRHGVPLKHYAGIDPVQVTPATTDQEGPNQQITVQREGERRFHRIMQELGDSRVSVVAPILVARFRELLIRNDLVVAGGADGSRLQSALNATFSPPWMEDVVPQLCGQNSGSIAPILAKRFFYHKISGAHQILALVIALVGEEQEAFDFFAIRPSETELDEMKVRSCGQRRVVLTKLYIARKGSVGSLSNQSDQVQDRLLQLGLPELDAQALSAALSFFVDGKSMEDSIAESGIERSRFEAIFRSAGSNLATALKAMSASQSISPNRKVA